MKDLEIRKMLQEAGLRNTQSRRDVLHHLVEAGEHAMTSHEIEQNIEDIDRITLYRILKTFEDAGLIHSVADGSGKTKYATCSTECKGGDHQHDHIHFHCRVCETTTCLDQVIPTTIRLPETYQVEHMEFVVSGVCSECH